MLGERPVQRLLQVFLDTEFEGGRHTRRVKKISGLERQNGQS
jgi:ribose 5-phosphate isomerase RpiB